MNDLNLLLEIKGYEVHNPEQMQAKHSAARKWATAVNNQGEFGRWDFLVCRDLDGLLSAIAGLLGVEAASGHVRAVTDPSHSGTLFG